MIEWNKSRCFLQLLGRLLRAGWWFGNAFCTSWHSYSLILSGKLRDRENGSMEYRGVEYRVGQKIDGTGWRWSLTLGERERIGTHPQKESAIHSAKKAIDEALARKRKIRPQSN